MTNILERLLRGIAMTQLDRITQEPGMMGGKACIRGMRVTVGMIVGQIGAGQSIDDILADYIPILSVRTSSRLFVMRRGGRRNAKFSWLADEAASHWPSPNLR